MAESIFEKLRRGLGLSAKPAAMPEPPIVRRTADDPVARRITAHFERLEKFQRGLPRKIGDFVSTGNNSSVMATLQSNASGQQWRTRVRYFPPRDESGLFSVGANWSAPQMRRLGEVLAALEPITSDWGFFGTKKSPSWLRHVVSIWLGHGRKEQSIDRLQALADDSELGVEPVLDILFSGLSRFAGVAEWLDRQKAPVLAAIPRLGADVRAEFATAISRFGLQAQYLEALVELAIGSSKSVRTAARQALTGADHASLTCLLAERYVLSAPSARAEMVDVAAMALGEDATPLLAGWRETETSAKVISAFERVSGAVSAPAATDAVDRPADGIGGYLAVDGKWVAITARDELPVATPIPDAVLVVLKPAMADFNARLATGKAEDGSKGWHWSRQFSLKGPRDLELLRKLGESDYKISTNQTAVDWLRSHQTKHPGVAEFFDHEGLTLYHLVRFALGLSHGHFQGLFNDWSGPVGPAIQRRLTNGADLRVVIDLWTKMGGQDMFADHLAQTWYQPLPEIDAPLWLSLAGRFAMIDEALGMVPQSGEKLLRPLPAFDLLRLFSKLPDRYRPRLMILANDSSARLRDGARALLHDAPGIEQSIARLLEGGKQETRALAADWLLRRGDRTQIAPIRKALKKERSELARAAMITALERLGDDVSDNFDQAAMVKEANAGLAKPGVKGIDWFPIDHLPALRWASGEAVDPVLPKWWLTLATRLKQPGGNALIDLWLDRLAPGDAHRLGWLVLTSWIEQDIRTATDAEANAYAAAHVDATRQQYLANIKRWPQSADYWTTDRDLIFTQLKRSKLNTYLGSAADSKGMLALASRVEGADAAQRIRIFLKEHGARVSQAKALLDVLASIGTSAALQAVLASANRSKQRSVQAYATELVAQIAERRGWSAAELADRTVPSGGLDADGVLELDCGPNRAYVLRLNDRDELVLLNGEGREVKALPGPRVDAEKPVIEAAKKLLSTARKETKQVLAAQTARLREAMCLERRWPREDWESFIAGHPIVGRLARRLVWIGFGEDGAITACFRPLGDGTYSDARDDDVDIAGFSEIQLAHSSLLDPAMVTSWRNHFADYAVTPPFDQIGRTLPSLPADLRKSRLIKDRAGWVIESFKLRSIAAKLGYDRSSAIDGGWFVSYERNYREAGIVAEIEFSGSPLPEENAPVALVALGFRKLRANGQGGGQLELGAVPAVLLAESWQDLHDMAAKGTGLDAEWQKKVNG